ARGGAGRVVRAPRRGGAPVTEPTTYAYFGPAGTFTEAALRSTSPAADSLLTPYATVPAALDAVRDGLADLAMVPIENSVEGDVRARGAGRRRRRQPGRGHPLRAAQPAGVAPAPDGSRPDHAGLLHPPRPPGRAHADPGGAGRARGEHDDDRVAAHG